jgi:hypothetical protein
MTSNNRLRSQVELAVRRKLTETDQAKIEKKSVLVVLDAGNVPIDAHLNQLNSCQQKGYNIIVFASSLASKSYDLDLVKASVSSVFSDFSTGTGLLNNLLKNVDLLLIPVLSITIMAKLVLGISDTPSSYLVGQALLQGKTLLAVNETHLAGQNNYAHHLNQKVIEYQKTLQKMGLTFVPIGHIANMITERKARVYFQPLANQKTELLSRFWVHRLPQNVEEIICSHSTIITPLAWEEAKKRNISIQPTEAKLCDET